MDVGHTSRAYALHRTTTKEVTQDDESRLVKYRDIAVNTEDILGQKDNTPNHNYKLLLQLLGRPAVEGPPAAGAHHFHCTKCGEKPGSSVPCHNWSPIAAPGVALSVAKNSSGSSLDAKTRCVFPQDHCDLCKRLEARRRSQEAQHHTRGAEGGTDNRNPLSPTYRLSQVPDPTREVIPSGSTAGDVVAKKSSCTPRVWPTSSEKFSSMTTPEVAEASSCGLPENNCFDSPSTTARPNSQPCDSGGAASSVSSLDNHTSSSLAHIIVVHLGALIAPACSWTSELLFRSEDRTSTALAMEIYIDGLKKLRNYQSRKALRFIPRKGRLLEANIDEYVRLPLLKTDMLALGMTDAGKVQLCCRVVMLVAQSTKGVLDDTSSTSGSIRALQGDVPAPPDDLAAPSPSIARLISSDACQLDNLSTTASGPPPPVSSDSPRGGNSNAGENITLARAKVSLKELVEKHGVKTTLGARSSIMLPLKLTWHGHPRSVHLLDPLQQEQQVHCVGAKVMTTDFELRFRAAIECPRSSNKR